jgi:hypothetical protein
VCLSLAAAADAARQLELFELMVLGDEARTPPPPLPPHNPLPRNDCPFGVSPAGAGGAAGGPFVLPAAQQGGAGGGGDAGAFGGGAFHIGAPPAGFQYGGGGGAPSGWAGQ